MTKQGRPRRPTTCGTVAGYIKHKRTDGDACADCLAAWAAHYREYRIRRKVEAFRQGLIDSGNRLMRPGSDHLEERVVAYERAIREGIATRKSAPPAYTPPKIKKVTNIL